MFKKLFKNREHQNLKFAMYCGLMIFFISSILSILLNFADPVSDGIAFGILFNIGFSVAIFLIIYITMRLNDFFRQRKARKIKKQNKDI